MFTNKLKLYPDAIAQLALKGLKAAITHFGQSPYLLIVPYTAAQVQTSHWEYAGERENRAVTVRLLFM